LTPVS